MNQGGMRKISTLLIVGLTLSCLFLLGNTRCFVSSSPQYIRGQFCAAEQTSVPISGSSDEIQQAVFLKNVTDLQFNTIIFTLSLIWLIFQTDVRKNDFAKRMRIQLIRYGPYQRIFLPYLSATHGF